MRLRGGFPRGNALRYVRDKHNVNLMACMCAIDKATLPALADFWAPGVAIGSLHELVGNALIMTGEKPDRTDLRGEPFVGQKKEEAEKIEERKEDTADA